MDTVNPIHHPHIWNACLNMREPCSLNVTTVSENSYELFDEALDMRSPYISAKEIRVKLKSKQSMIQVTWNDKIGAHNVALTDSNTLCQEINEYALQVAKKHLPKERLKLYEEVGIKVVFLQDIMISMVEPLWSYMPLRMVEDLEKQILSISSPALLTSVNLQWKEITMMAGLHYCKLVSPARLAEYLFTDSLRLSSGASK
jgi:hypothetical protein